MSVPTLRLRYRLMRVALGIIAQRDTSPSGGMADAADSKSVEVNSRIGSSPISGTILKLLWKRAIATFRFQCPVCNKYTYHAVSDACLESRCMEVRCEVCNQWVSVVFNPVICMSGDCERSEHQPCMKFKTVKVPIPRVRPVILMEL
jgi:hypothetical protein